MSSDETNRPRLAEGAHPIERSDDRSDERSDDGSDACRALKTKMFYVTGWEDRFAPSATAQYWCVRTMSQIGPDDRQVRPEHCCVGRDCHEAE